GCRSRNRAGMAQGKLRTDRGVARMNNATRRIEFYTSPMKTLGLINLGVLMTLAGWWCTNLPELKAKIAGYVGMPFFALATVMIVVRLFQTRPHVILSPEGIEVRQWKIGLIPWTDIESVFIWKRKSQRILCFTSI